MDWKNVNLNSSFERSQNIIDPLDFDTLLMEVECNCPEIDEKALKEQFETDLKARILSAREIFTNNLQNLLEAAKKERAKK